MPETSIAQVTLGMPATVTIPQFTAPIDAIITEIGSAAGSGNTFPVKAALVEPPDVRAGMTAEVSVLLGEEDGESAGYLIPLSAIAPGDNSGEGIVFIYDRETATVRRTVVEATQALEGNVIAVTGVGAGDVLASAGVNFLVDGQRVELMVPALASDG